jgi:predicted transcriptional regulator
MNAEPDFRLFRPDRPGIRKVLGDLEAEIMELIWARPGDQRTTVREIFEIMYERRHLGYTTIMNTMVRLTKKGLLRVEKQDKAYVYLPVFTQQEFISQFVDRILKDLIFNFSGATMESLRALPDSEEVRLMQQRLDELARRRTEEEGEEM